MSRALPLDLVSDRDQGNYERYARPGRAGHQGDQAARSPLQGSPLSLDQVTRASYEQVITRPRALDQALSLPGHQGDQAGTARARPYQLVITLDQALSPALSTRLSPYQLVITRPGPGRPGLLQGNKKESPATLSPSS